jgi:pyochelin synthetase
MSSVTALLRELRTRGITVSAVDGRLKIQAPSGSLTPALRDQLAAHKQHILQWLHDSVQADALALPTCVPDAPNRYEPFPLSDMQLGFYMADDPYLEFHVRPHYYIEKNVDGLDVARYEAAWNKALARHAGEIVIVQSDGRLVTVSDPAPLRCRVLDLDAAAPEAVQAALDEVRGDMMRSELPLDRWPWVDLRVTRWRDGDRTRARIHYNHNNFFSDGYGTTRLLQEIDSYYQDPDTALPPLTLTFRDAALTLDAVAHSPAGAAAREYWERRLDDLPGPPNLPVRPELDRRCRSRLQRREAFLPAASWSAFKAHAMRHGVTASNAVFGAYAEVLGAFGNSRHFVLSNMMTRRLNIHPEIRDIVGNFASLYPLEIDFRQDNTFVDRARAIQEQVIRDAQHLQWGGMQVMQALNRRKASLGTAAIPFVIGSGLFMEGFERSDFSCLETSQVMLDHQFWEVGDGRLFYVWDLLEEFFPDGFISSMWEAYHTLIERLAHDAALWDARAIDLTPAAMLEARRSVTPPERPLSSLTLDALLAETVASAPDAAALLTADGQLTFGALDAASTRLAAGLRAAASVRGRNVAIVADRGPALVKAVYAVLKAGAAYVPVEASLPADRRSYVLENCDAAAVLAEEKYAAGLEWPAGALVLSIEATEAAVPAAPVHLDDPVRPSELGYLIYTSGSTGRPKGVMIEHSGAVNTILDVNERFGVGPADRIFGVSSFGFDLSVYDLFGGVACGAALVYPDPRRSLDPSHWLDVIEAHQVTVWNSAPPLALLLVEAAERRHGTLRHLRLVMLSGDWIPVDLPDRLRRVAPGARVVSLGGATEASIWSIQYDIGEVDPAWRSIPYGYPMQNQPWHILDEWGRPTPDWTSGDLYIAGSGLARGYWNDAEKTAASFVHHPATGERIYRTGDIGRYRPGALIEFMGRKDSQVKIQGHRIELGEIESVLLALPSVSAAVAAVQPSAAGRPQLVAYVVPVAGAGLEAEALREALAAKLPDYMVPRFIRVLDGLPLTGNGKVDRKALPRIDEQAAAPRTVARGPGDAIEEQLLAIWRDLLRQPDLTVTDDFFDVGGQSFDAVRIIGATREAFDVSLTLGSIWKERTVERIADVIRQGTGTDQAGSLVDLRELGAHQTLFLVHPAGGHVLCYRGLAERLNRPICAFQAPGLEGHGDPLDSIEALAKGYVERLMVRQPAGPVFLGGWSSGALIAFEMAVQLRERGREVGGLVVIDCPSPRPSGPIDARVLLAWFLEDLALNLPIGELVQSIDLHGLTPEQHIEQVAEVLKELGRDLGDIGALTDIYRVFLGIVRGSRRYAGAFTDVDIFLVRATDGLVSEFACHPAAASSDWGWQSFTSGEITMRTSRGTHHTLLSKDSVPSIADSIEQWLFHREELAALSGEIVPAAAQNIVESVASRTSSLRQISAAC